MERTNRGITLIALIITIIIMLILAGIVLSLTLGEHGIINRTKEAGKQTEIASIKEQIQIDIIDRQSVSQGNITDVEIKAILEKYGTINYEEDGITIKGITTKEKGYEILFKDIWKERLSKGKVANEPDIEGFNKENTYYVTWNLNNVKTIYEPNEIKMKENKEPSNWYDYTEGINRWANIKTIGGGNECYWVWIPRYAYQVPDRTSGGESINIKFLEETTNIPIDGSNITISNNTKQGSWNIHPAFWWDENNNGIEEQEERLRGIWVAKYKASSNNVSVASLATDLTTTGGGDNAKLKVRLIPNVTTWRGITVNNIFTVCRNMTSNGNSLEGSSHIDTHMMKNVEWGAVAYLSRSKYGKNSPIWNNPYYNNTNNYSTITGLCGKGENKQDLSTTNLNDTCKYNEIGGGNASTSGNVYGVYDMTGGVFEYVAGYLSGVSANANYTNLANADNRYKDTYVGTSNIDTINYLANINKYGDAIYETSVQGTGKVSWDLDCSYFIYSSEPVFLRGGRARR